MFRYLQFALLLLCGFHFLNASAVSLKDELPASIQRLDDQTLLIDYGRVSFGNLRVDSPFESPQEITVHFGEASKGGRVDRKPPGTVRYAKTSTTITSASTVVAPKADKRNSTHSKAVLTPKEWGVILPFRWVEVVGHTGPIKPEQWIRQSAFPTTWDDAAASFECSAPLLNRIWELCRYSIKATSFAGVYVDGDRERIPYEADAYLNQLSDYATNNDVQMARDTFDLLMKQPTWPTEWAPHMVFVARADWMHTADRGWLEERYESLKTKLLLERAGTDGLITSNERQVKRDDIVDWPIGERDHFVFTDRNSVVNAFHLRALKEMAEIAKVCGKTDEARDYLRILEKSKKAYQEAFYDDETGLYKDGISTQHISIHANLFPLAFGLVPEGNREHITQWLKTRGMTCSVYAAQYLLEALFENGADQYAMDLMTANNDRSWRHMVESGTTITWEAWDMKYKPNQDWNHAWGAAPANILPRFVIGAQALTPGWETIQIRPHLSGLTYAKGKVPTPRGAIQVEWKLDPEFSMMIRLPQSMKTEISIPQVGTAKQVYLNGQPVPSTLKDGYFHLEPRTLQPTTRIELK
ncbi:MAG: alpha-L-rhamnosidase C-terminal domain-containing protein [Opitutaceae bacterium]